MGEVYEFAAARALKSTDHRRERAVLGGLILNPQVLPEVAWMLRGAFDRLGHAEVFEAIAAIVAEHPELPQVDIADLLGRLRSKQVLHRMGGENYVAELTSAASLAVSIPTNAEALAELAAARRAERDARSADAALANGRLEVAAELYERAANELRPRETPGHATTHALGAGWKYSQVRGGEWLAERFGSELRFTEGRGWFAWTGTHWVPNSLRAVEAGEEVARSLAAEANEDQELGNKRSATAERLLSRSFVNAALFFAEHRRHVPITSFDADPWAFNCSNGTIDLRTGELQPHDRDRLCSKLSPVSYEADAAAPRWEAFLEQVLPDPEVRAFVQRLVGYAMCGEIRDHILPVFHGKGGNGKGAFQNAIGHIFGDYGRAVSSELLMMRERDDHPTERAQLMGLRLARVDETKEGRALDEGTVKHLTGGDPINARHMYGNPFEFQPTHKLILSTNHKPKVRGTDNGIWRRVLLVPWNVVIPKHEQDAALGAKLRAEAPGILRWCVEGCLAWQREGLAPPAAVQSATEAYRTENNAIERFLAERCVQIGSARTPAAELFHAYEAWCRDEGETAVSQTAFGRSLANEHGLEKKKTKTVVVYQGIGLLVPDDEDPSEG